MHVAMTGLTTLGLDRIWWMVSPQNPLKSTQPPYEHRVKSVEALGLHNKMEVSHFEKDNSTQYTCDTLSLMRERYSKTRFVFLMGADNFLQLPKWKNWRSIVETTPIAVIARPDKRFGTIRSRLGTAARIYADYRVPESQAHTLQDYKAPAWTFLTLPLNPLSSTQIRNAAKS